MELIHTARAHGRYGYYMLLSGQCYHLRHMDDIYNCLCSNYPEPNIEVISPEIVTIFAHPYKYIRIEPYFGSQWWILPDVAIDEISALYGDKFFAVV